MRICIIQYRRRYEVETENDDLMLDEVMDIFKGLVMSAGYRFPADTDETNN